MSGMRDAYIILAHRAPWLIDELAEYLGPTGHDVYVHADKGSGLADRIQAAENVHVISHSIKIEWADWSMIQATLELIKAVRQSGKKYRYVHLLSGQCLPAMPAEMMDAELNKAYAEGLQFIECEPLPRPHKWIRDGGIHRVGTWYPRCMVSKYSPWHKWFWWYTNKWIRLRLRRPLYYVFRPFFGGAQWWSLTGECVDALGEYAEKHPMLRFFFRNTFCSDELFFQTCIMRTPYGASVVNDNRRFLKWPTDEAQSPIDIQPEHWAEVWNSGALFARKFRMVSGQIRLYLQNMERRLKR